MTIEYPYHKDHPDIEVENKKLKQIVRKLIIGKEISEKDDNFLSLVMEDEE